MLSRRLHTEDCKMLTNIRKILLSCLLAWQFAEGLVNYFGGVDAGVETYHHGTFSSAGCRTGRGKPSASSSNLTKGQWLTESAEPMSQDS